MQTVGYHSEEVSQLFQLARDAALALDQQDEAAEAGIRMSQFLYGNCRHRDVLEIGDVVFAWANGSLAPGNARARLGIDGLDNLLSGRFPQCARLLGKGDGT
jgi:hypothetical protein